MKLKYKKLKITALILFVVIAFLNMWTTRPVDIIYERKQLGVYDDFVVDHLPFNDKDRINWYLDHKYKLLKNYSANEDNYYDLTFWDIGDGFLGFKENMKRIDDLYCFDEMNVEKRCIEKNILLRVRLDRANKEHFYIGYSNNSYIIDKDGKISATRDEQLFERMRGRYK